MLKAIHNAKEYAARIYWRAYLVLFGLKAEPAPPIVRDRFPRFTKKQWLEMVTRFERADPDAIGRLDAYACLICKRITVAIQSDAGRTPTRILCETCPKVKRIGQMSFPQSTAWAMSARHGRGTGVDKLTVAMASIEAFRPSYGEYCVNQSTVQRLHLEAGGLLSRPFRKV